MKRLLLFLFTGCSIFSYGQNVGINTAAPTAALDVNGDFILRSADLTLANGNNLVDVGTLAYSNFRITGPTTAFNVTGLSYSWDGKLVTLFNRSGFTMTVVNESPAEAVSERIITGTGADVTIPNNASVNFQYDLGAVRWVLRSHSAAVAGGGVGGGWGLNGNAGTNPNTDFIGTTDNQPFIIKSSNQTVAMFQFGSPSNNYIGTNFQRTGIGVLGTGAPTHTLEVGLADLAGGSQGVLGIRGTTHITHFNYGANEAVYIRGGKDGSPILLNDGPASGNVAIGTGIPDANTKLTLQTAGDGATALSIRNPSGSVTFNAFVGGPANGNTISLGTPGAMPVAFYTNSANRIFIAANGNIGIGTDNPVNKLSVNGDIRSREVTVETANWPDYVFEQEYKLRPLAEVEQFIIQHKHLPEIPTANDMHSNGLKLGDLQKKMMEKIEELTLYIIQQQKQIDHLLKANGNLNQ
ncbi:MAG: hypothetical protein V4722_19880 [Bacteroidota bacterium]